MVPRTPLEPVTQEGTLACCEPPLAHQLRQAKQCTTSSRTRE